MEETEAIVQTVTSALPELRSNYYVKLIGIFGSYAKGTQRKDSDIDFAIKFSDECPDLFENKHRLKEYLRNLLHKNIDIANIEYLKPYVMENIKDELFYVG